MIVTLIILIFYFGFIFTKTGVQPTLLIFITLILLLIASFSTLNVTIDHEYLRIKFGYGLFKKKFNLKEIVSVRTVKNKWYYGWGIRYWFWPPMRIYNVSGFDAVELKMINSKVFRIGTDEPQKLHTILKEVAKQ